DASNSIRPDAGAPSDTRLRRLLARLFGGVELNAGGKKRVRQHDEGGYEKRNERANEGAKEPLSAPARGTATDHRPCGADSAAEKKRGQSSPRQRHAAYHRLRHHRFSDSLFGMPVVTLR